MYEYKDIIDRISDIAKIDILEKIFSCLNCTSIIYSLKICTIIEQRLNK
jgi:hypothetical protein